MSTHNIHFCGKCYLIPWNSFSLSNLGSLSVFTGATNLFQFLRMEKDVMYGFPENCTYVINAKAYGGLWF